MRPGVSIVIPITRTEKVNDCLKAIAANAGDIEYEIISKVDKSETSVLKKIIPMIAQTKYDLVLLLGDDSVPQAGFLEEAVATMETFEDGWGVVGLMTELRGDWMDYGHVLSHKKMLEFTGGESFYSTEYHHCFSDDELRDIASEMGRFKVAKGSKILHDHPFNGRGDSEDAALKISYSDDVLAKDRKTYIRRKRERYGNKIAIGFPLVDPTVPVQFFTSYACMEKPESYTLLVPKFPHGPWGMSIADARNSLVEQAQMEGARYLLMLDTDQVYPHDTLTKLMSHKVDICGVRVHRRWMPFDPIFLRGELGKYHNVSDEEAYSGDLIEIDATGTGCLLFDMQIGDKIDGKWFEFGFVDGRHVGEDINFCSKARSVGVRIFVDTSIEVGHLITMEVNKTLHQMCKVLTPKT